MDKSEITPAVVKRLLAEQFPQWADLPVTRVELDGWDNTTFRLGDEMSVRLPSGDAYTAQVDKEHRWLPDLAPQLPLPIPQPLAKGAPSEEFPRPWSIYRWLEGEPATSTGSPISNGSPPTSRGSSTRCTGSSPSPRSPPARTATSAAVRCRLGCADACRDRRRSDGQIDGDAALAAWERALEARFGPAGMGPR